MRRFLAFIKSFRNNLQKNEQSSDLQNDEDSFLRWWFPTSSYKYSKSCKADNFVFSSSLSPSSLISSDNFCSHSLTIFSNFPIFFEEILFLLI